MSDEKHVKLVYDMLLDYARENKSKEFKNYPIWCWYQIDMAPLNDGIKIELDVPDELVLLTDYYDWGGSVIPTADTYVNDFNQQSDYINELHRVFAICVNPEMFRDDIQAIIPYIKESWVTNLESLKNIVNIN